MDIKTLRARVLGLAQTVNTSAEGSANYIRYKPIYDAAKAELERVELLPVKLSGNVKELLKDDPKPLKKCVKCEDTPRKWPINPNDPDLCWKCHNAVQWPAVYLYPGRIYLPMGHDHFVIDKRLADRFGIKLNRCHSVAPKHQKNKHGRDIDAHIYPLTDPSVPLPLKIYCPRCDMMHIDAGEWRTKPHHKHLCEDCGHTWAPFPFNTVGIQ